MMVSIFFKIFEHLECTADLVRGALFLPNFSKKPAKKFISSYFLVSQTRGALIHFLIPNWSEYAPDSLGARGVANPGASFFDREANFFAPKMRPDVRTKCARFHHETAKAPGVANQAKRATPAACQRVDCGITKNLPHSRRKPPSAAKHPICKPWDDNSR